MIDEVFELMKCFPDSFVNAFGEVILSKKGNVYICIKYCKTKTDIILKLLEYASRPMAKGIFYSSDKKNNELRENLIDCLNKYLGTSFTHEDMYWIYDKLGNGVNPALTAEFIYSGYDLSLVYPKKRGGVDD